MSSLQFKLAIRQLKKNKAFTLLNILGLTLGLTTFLLIVLYVTDELNFDRYNTKFDRIVRLNTDVVLNSQPSAFADAAPPVAATLKAHFPEVEQTARISPLTDASNSVIRFRKGDREISEIAVAQADPTLFQIFDLPMLKGDPSTALNDPHSIVLTESAARRYFNTTDIVGRTIYRVDDNTLHTITGVIRDFPAQSSFRFDFLLSMHADKGMDLGDNFYVIEPISTFVLLKPGANRAAFDKKLDNLMRTYVKEYADMEKENEGKYSVRLSEMPLTAIHLHSHRSDEIGINGDIQYVYIFSAIAVFVLLIAGINFVNLSTACSAGRAREVGVRKVLGSPRRQLIAQFLTESLLLTTAAALLALGITALAMPWFN
ncbi:MAG TPA: ABC transporter permease, partial [Puia sp.]